jgi:hypothetical protein
MIFLQIGNVYEKVEKNAGLKVNDAVPYGHEVQRFYSILLYIICIGGDPCA